MRKSKNSAILMTAIFFGAMPSANAALTALYQFNNAGNLGEDTSGANNNAVNFGAAYSTAGYQGGAASFNGAAFLRSAVNADPGAAPQFTWGAWAKPTSIVPNTDVLSADNGGFDRTLTIDYRASGNWASFTGGTGGGVFNSGVAPSTSAWTFVAAVYDQSISSMTFYVDGSSWTTSANFGPSWPFFDIGHNPSYGDFFNGLIDNVFTYNQALTPAEIANIQTNGFPSGIPEPSTMALLGMGALFGLRRRRALPSQPA